MPQPNRGGDRVPIGELISAELARLRFVRAQAPALEEVFDAMRQYREHREQAEEDLPYDQIEKLVSGRSIALAEGEATLSLDGVIASGFDGVVTHGIFEDGRGEPQSHSTAVKLLVPFKPNERVEGEEATTLLEERMYAAATELIAHERCAALRFDFVPKLYAATILENPANREERLPILVMEFVQGTTLRSLAADVSQGKAHVADLTTALQRMSEQVETLARSGIYLWDSNPRNAIVQLGAQLGEVRLVMFDFAHGFVSEARHRYAEYAAAGTSDFKWASSQNYRDLTPRVVRGLGEAYAEVCSVMRGSKHVNSGFLSFFETHVEEMRQGNAGFDRTKHVLRVMSDLLR